MTSEWTKQQVERLQGPQRKRQEQAKQQAQRLERKLAMCARGFKYRWNRGEHNAKELRYSYDEPARERADKLWLERNAKR